MFTFPDFRASRLVRPLLLAVAAGTLALGLAACSTDDDLEATATGTPFTQALFKDYSDLSHQAATLPAAPTAEEPGFFD